VSAPATTDASRILRLARHSVAVIRANQAPSGAYIASPNFPVYRYSWLRDGAFIADAMSRVGDIGSAEAFFGWCARVLLDRRERIESLIDRRSRGVRIDPTDFLHTRYTLDGRESREEWTDFQLDGYGAWLWALDAHRRRHGRPIDAFLEGAILSGRYVATFWDHPSYDWWEEHPDHRHTSTLAALHAGLTGASDWTELDAELRSEFRRAAEAIHEVVLADAGRLGRLPKWLGGDATDASLLACATPFHLVAPEDPLMVATTAAIEAVLVHDGGVHRYADDTYYGGGEWLLLAGFLGWHYVEAGRSDDAWAELAWIVRHATAVDDLPEQVPDHLLAPAQFVPWTQRWGSIATPLLWSHAMYLTLALALGAVGPEVLALPTDDVARPSPAGGVPGPETDL
jgi:GH15 family glucan-1,4-alpha-glucosidase